MGAGRDGAAAAPAAPAAAAGGPGRPRRAAALQPGAAGSGRGAGSSGSGRGAGSSGSGRGAGSSGSGSGGGSGRGAGSSGSGSGSGSGGSGAGSRRAGPGTRLESIRAVHESESKKSTTRMEDYLEVIAELVELKGYATTLDVSRYMGVSAPSVTKMLQRLDENGHLEYEKYRGICLTAKGSRLAEAVRQKHSILLEFFEILGVSRDTADRDAEGIEHHLDAKTIRQLRKFITYLRSHPEALAGFRNL